MKTMDHRRLAWTNRNETPTGTLAGGQCDNDEDSLLDRAVMAIAVTENKPAKQIIEKPKVAGRDFDENRPCLYDENGDRTQKQDCAHGMIWG